MTGTPDHHDITGEQRERSQEPIRYPTNHVLAVLDTGEQVTATVAALTKRGFLESEVEVGTGAERADALHAATGHVGLTDLMIRLAQRYMPGSRESSALKTSSSTSTRCSQVTISSKPS